MILTDVEFGLLREFLHRETGIDVPESKRYLFTTRLLELLEKQDCRNYSELLLRLGSGQQELVRATIEAMTTHESGLFREPHHFEALFDPVLPTLLERKGSRASMGPTILRFLSAGCSFGQEAYTMAICAERWLESHGGTSPVKFEIVGVDISERALDRAREGSYTDLEMGPHMTPEDRDRFFSRRGDYWQLDESIRGKVSFEYANLSKPLRSIGPFDVIFCRNVVIYFSSARKVAVLERLRDALDPGGALFIGSAESLYGIDVGFVQRSFGRSTWYEHPAGNGNNEEVRPWKS